MATDRQMLLVLLLWMSGVCLVQGADMNTQFRPKRLHYENAGGEKGVTTHVYDGDHRCVRSVWELLDGSRWSVNTYKRDQAGRIIGKYRLFSDGKRSEQSFQYDESGRLVTETFARSDGVIGKARYEFTDDGKQETAVCDNRNGWFTGVIRYQLDEQGRRVSGTVEKEGRQVGTITFRYNDTGLLELETWTLGDWTQTFRTEYERINCLAPTTSNPFVPGNCNWMVTGENYTFNGTVGGPSAYAYDEAGRLAKKVFTRSDGVETATTYLYDEQNVLTRSVRRFADGREVVFRYRFDDNRRLVERSWTDAKGRPCREVYQYGPDGRLSRARYDSMDGWLTGDLVFAHDRYGRLKTGVFSADDGFTAALTFDYGDRDVPTEIRWDFSQGYSQVYQFQYEPRQ